MSDLLWELVKLLWVCQIDMSSMLDLMPRKFSCFSSPEVSCTTSSGSFVVHANFLIALLQLSYEQMCLFFMCKYIYIYIDVFPGFPKTTFLNQWPTEYFRYLYISYLAASFWVSIGIINSTWSLFWVLLQDIELSSLRHPSYILLGA